MSASLSRRNGEAANDPVVVGYSEVGKAQDAAESQQAVSLQTGANVQRTLINMLFTIEDLIKTFYDDDCAKELAENPRDSCGGKDPDKELIESKFRLYTPEITAIANFFLAKDTARVAGLLGSEAFDIDFDSLVAIMRQYKDDTDALFDAGASDDKKKAARKDLVERTKLFWFDFSYIRDEIDVEEYRLTAALNKKAIQKNEIPACFTKDDFDYLKTRYDIISDLIKDPNTSKDSINDLNSKLEKVLYAEAIKCYSHDWTEDIARTLQAYLVAGQMFLGASGVKPGDTVILRVEAKESAGAPIGIPAQFQFKIRDRRTRVAVSPSLLFIKRLDVTEADIATTNPNAIKPVNFSPFPGVTFGATFHSRGLKKVSNKPWEWEASPSGRNRFLGALAPGIGINVTFMNFGDPRDFNPTANMGAGGFTTTTGSNFEVGAGIVGSLFDNNLQFTYGFNLNADRKRAYFGIGFGFVEVGKRLAAFISQ